MTYLPVLIPSETKFFVKVFRKHVFDVGTTSLWYTWEDSIVLANIFLSIDTASYNWGTTFYNLQKRLISTPCSVSQRTKGKTNFWFRYPASKDFTIFLQTMIFKALYFEEKKWGNLGWTTH